jgi:hypothetical protein
LPKGTWLLTHSALRGLHDMLEGCSIHTVYEITAHDSRTMKGAAIKVRRSRRLRWTADALFRSPGSALPTIDAEPGGESPASDEVLTPEREPDRSRRIRS